MMRLRPAARQVYALIRHYDPELADTFYRFYQEHPTAHNTVACVHGELVQLNTFFREMLSQIDVPSLNVRVCLDDGISEIPQWLAMFEQEVLPVLQEHRFPVVTKPFVEPFYGALAHG